MTRALCRIAFSAALSLVLIVDARAGEPLSIYTDSLAPGWQNWSWSTAVNFVNANPVHGASGTSIAVTHDAAWAGFYLHNASYINVSEYTTLRFWIHGGAAGGHALRIVAYDAQLTEGTGVTIAPPPAAGTWREVEIPLNSFNLITIGGLAWQDTAGHAQPTYYLDDIAYESGPSPPPGVGPALTVDVAAGRQPISPYIYGMNFADPALIDELRLPVSRWGGNATTRYNWQNDTSNRASDWFFENIPNDNSDPSELPTGSASDWFVEQNRAAGADTLLTISLIGWTPRAREYAGGFSVTRYGPQQGVDPWRSDFGNGVRLDGSLITGNDPLDTSIAIGPAFVQAWMNHLIGRYGGAGGGGVRFYNLDNEPMLWNSTHRDVHPTPVGYDELRDRTIAYAAAIKAADPAAQVLGPAEWGWSGYFFSALDVAAGGDWWNSRPDRRAHGDIPLVEWYLQELRDYETAGGTRILDYFDLHYYPQANVALQPAGDTAMQTRRLRSTRSLWDPAYIDESWIAEPVRLLPRMREWVDANYPGTKLAVGEYNWGGLEHINGALTQADVLGIFGREGLDLATIWDPPGTTQPGAFAFRVYRNYDGAGGAYGDTRVAAASADQSRVSIYAAQRTAGGALTLVLVNKTNEALTSSLSVANFALPETAQLYRYSAADLTRIVHESDAALPGGAIDLTLPAQSISLLVVASAATLAGDIDGDCNVDLADLTILLSHFGTANGAEREEGDLDGDADVDLSDLTALLSDFGSVCP